jgi:hypothetical protein
MAIGLNPTRIRIIFIACNCKYDTECFVVIIIQSTNMITDPLHIHCYHTAEICPEVYIRTPLIKAGFPLSVYLSI